MLAACLDGQAKIAEDIALKVDGEHGLAEGGVEGEEAIAKAFLMVRWSGRERHERHAESSELEALHGGERELSQPGKVADSFQIGPSMTRI
jgi:hypothetical protein